MLYKQHIFNAKKSCDIRNMRKMADKAPRPLCQFLKIKLPDRLTKVLVMSQNLRIPMTKSLLKPLKVLCVSWCCRS